MNLTQLANKYGTDKGTTAGRKHGYTEIYEKYFAPLRQKSINLLEIGVQCGKYNKNHQIGPSLKMWHDYFPNGMIYGFDVHNYSTLNSPRIKVFQGDQAKKQDLLQILKCCPRFDIIIDDGSHAPYDQQASFHFLFPYVKENGVYVVEDLFRPKHMRKAPCVLDTKDFLKLLGWQVNFYRSELLGIVIKKLNF
jgi:hypothetical protein